MVIACPYVALGMEQADVIWAAPSPLARCPQHSQCGGWDHERSIYKCSKLGAELLEETVTCVTYTREFYAPYSGARVGYVTDLMPLAMTNYHLVD